MPWGATIGASERPMCASFVGEVVVGDHEIRMRGPKLGLAKATIGGGLPPGRAGWSPVLFESGVPHAMKLRTGRSLSRLLVVAAGEATTLFTA
jgi:hypothetical protein